MTGAAYEEVRLLLEANKYPPQVIGAFRAEVLREEARNLRKVEREDTPEGALGTRTGLLRAALILDERADAEHEKGTREGVVSGAAEGRIVAYRDPNSPRVLLCREHGPRYVGMVPVTSEELPDGGICTFGRLSSLECGKDVLIDGAEQGEKDTAPAATSTPHHERDRCMHGTSFNVECGGCDALGQIGGGAV